MVKRKEQVEVAYCDACGKRAVETCNACGGDMCLAHTTRMSLQIGLQSVGQDCNLCPTCTLAFSEMLSNLEATLEAWKARRALYGRE